MEEELVARLEERSLDPKWPARALEAARLLCLSDDLTPWEDRLADTFRRLDNLELIQAVADALATHYLKQNRLTDFEALLGRTRHADSLLRGLESVDQPGPALGLMARHNPRILSRLLGQRPDLVGIGLDAAFREAPDRLPALLQDLALWRRMPLEGALDLMLQLLERGTPASRRQTAMAFRLAAEAGADVGALRGPLTLQTDPETRRTLEYALALSACRQRDWPTLDELLPGEGALKALHVAWVEQGLDLPEIATRVVRALPASEPTYIEARRRGRQALPDEAAVLAQTEPSGVLYWLMVEQPERARLLEPRLSGEARRVAGEIASGTHRKVCRTCRNLPRRVSVSHASQLPPEIQAFGLSLESEGLQPTSCPECGAPYTYRYEREYDDMSLDETFTLERKRPAPDRSLLAHMDPNLRREGAWSMAASGDTVVLAELLASPHPEVREEALAVVRTPLEPELEARLLDLLPDVKALLPLTRHYNERSDWESLARLLEPLEPRLQATLLANLRDAPAELVLEPALRLLGDPDRETGRLAGNALRRLKALDPTLARIDELWNEAACGLWQNLAEDGEPAERLMEPASRRMLEFAGCYSILLGLQALARQGQSLTPAIPALAQALQQEKLWHLNDVMRVAGFALDGPEEPRLVAALGHASRRQDAARSAVGVLASASKRGWDMEPAAEALEALLRSEEGWEREMAAQAWTLHLLRHERFDEIGALLAHGVENVRGATATALANSDRDYTPLQHVLERNVAEGSGYTRDCAAQALERIGLA